VAFTDVGIFYLSSVFQFWFFFFIGERNIQKQCHVESFWCVPFLDVDSKKISLLVEKYLEAEGSLFPRDGRRCCCKRLMVCRKCILCGGAETQGTIF